VKLPPWPYANQLVQQFELFVGHDYHWYRRTEFHHKLDTAFRDPQSPYVRDRVWLSQLFVVFALGASYFSCIAPSIELYDNNNSGHSDGESSDGYSYETHDTVSPVPSGAEFFEQALKLFKLPTEEYHVSHVEVLNLMVGSTGCRKVSQCNT
jgi:proline utilization trans-activator